MNLEQPDLFSDVLTTTPYAIRSSDQPDCDFVIPTSSHPEGFHVSGRRFGAFYAHNQVDSDKYWTVSFWNGAYIALPKDGLSAFWLTKKKALELAADFNASIPESLALLITRTQIKSDVMTTTEATVHRLIKECLERHVKAYGFNGTWAKP